MNEILYVIKCIFNFKDKRIRKIWFVIFGLTSYLLLFILLIYLQTIGFYGNVFNIIKDVMF